MGTPIEENSNTLDDILQTVNNLPTGGGVETYAELPDKPKINNVTLMGNQTAADLGLGNYSKPSGGIPKSDLASAVQTSLGKADSALQSHQDISGKVDKPSSTDNHITRFNGSTGNIQNSSATLSDNGDIITAGYFKTSNAFVQEVSDEEADDLVAILGSQILFTT